MKIIFKDFLDKEINEEQALLSDEYSKVFVSPDGLVKKEEMYADSKLERIHYYKDNNETEDEAREQLTPYNVPFDVREREKYGDFIIIRIKSYTDSLLTNKWKFLAGDDDFILCTQPIDMASGEPIYEQTTKYLGDYTDDLDASYCKFVYNNEGGFQYCDYNYVRDYESEIFEIDRLAVIKERFKLSNEMYNYYLTAELLPPLK